MIQKITAGYGLPEDQSFPAQLETYLRARGHDWRVVNAGVSGDTTRGGLTRLDWALADKPDLVIVELGANDGLRGASLDVMRENLDAIVDACRRANARVLLVGMRIPPNYGMPYADWKAKHQKESTPEQLAAFAKAQKAHS